MTAGAKREKKSQGTFFKNKERKIEKRQKAEEAGEKKEKQKNTENPKEQNETKKCLILFIGNLPYGITEEQVKKFFKNRDIKSVRLLTEKEGGAPRGCGFVEFTSTAGYLRGLEYHGQQLDGRKVRVQKSAGGGGKSPIRGIKLKDKNRGLDKRRKQMWEKRRSKKSTEDKEGKAE